MRTFKIVEDGKYNKKILLLNKGEQTPWCKKPGNDIAVEVLVGVVHVESDTYIFNFTLHTGDVITLQSEIPWWIVAKEKSVVLLTIC